MAKITQVTIINSSTIRLDTDAKAGDEINLLELSKIDNSILQAKLNEEVQKKFNEQLAVEKKNFEALKQSAVIEATESYKLEILTLKNNIANFESQKESSINLVKAELKNSYLEKISSLEQEISNLKNELKLNKSQSENDKNMALVKQQEEYLSTIREQDKVISDLKLAKSSLNIKRLGEQLESWCNTEYENYAQCGFNTCTWEKDNIAIKKDEDDSKTKADYIFKVYASDSFLAEELLTSVACEMKNESPTSVNKKKNSDHYKKLDKDRNKKQCEYALLISELEWDQPNDVPIKKVKEYEKMYVVRPQYFISFLSVLASFSLKYKELLLDNNKQQLAFKDAIIIKQEFDKFKNDLIDKTINKLVGKLEASTTQAQAIKDAADKIIGINDELINKTLDNMKRKIEAFNIEKLSKKIDKYNQENE